MPTISDVAKRAKVSKTTVSRVLNGVPVREDNRRRVLDAIKELEYRPNAQARSLTSGKTDVVGVLVPYMDGPFYGAILEGCQQTLWDHGFCMIVCSTHHKKGNEPNIAKLLLEKRVDGLIIITPREIKDKPMQTLLRESVDAGFPIVVADGELDPLTVSGVWVDNFAGGYGATSYLLQLGHPRIGLVLGPEYAVETVKRFNGYKRALKDHGIAFDPDLVVSADSYQPESAVEVVPKLLEANPTAVFACSDDLAFGVMEVAKQVGLTLPRDLSIVGYDDLLFARFLTPKLTTVAQPLRQLGQVAAGKVIRMITGEEKEITQITLATELVIRESTCVFEKRSRSHGSGHIL